MKLEKLEALNVQEIRDWIRDRLRGADPFFPLSGRDDDPPYFFIGSAYRQSTNEDLRQMMAGAISDLLGDVEKGFAEDPVYIRRLLMLLHDVPQPIATERIEQLVRNFERRDLQELALQVLLERECEEELWRKYLPDYPAVAVSGMFRIGIEPGLDALQQLCDQGKVDNVKDILAVKLPWIARRCPDFKEEFSRVPGRFPNEVRKVVSEYYRSRSKDRKPSRSVKVSLPALSGQKASPEVRKSYRPLQGDRQLKTRKASLPALSGQKASPGFKLPATPLMDFLAKLAGIETQQRERLSAAVVEKMMLLPESEEGKSKLEKIEETFKTILDDLQWNDVGLWVQSWLLPYKEGLEELAETVRQARKLHRLDSHLAIVVDWNKMLREQVRQLLDTDPGDRRILCAFSAAVDATYSLNPTDSLADDSPDSLARLVAHAAGYKGVTPEQLLKAADNEYQRSRTDRNDVSTVEELLAEIMFGYQHPRANLKPNLTPGGEAEDWARRFFIEEKNGALSLGGGGASVNIVDALAGLRLLPDGFWPYHPQLLAERHLACAGEMKNYLSRRWFGKGKEWRWEQSDFSEAGNTRDGTGREHPVRLSLIFSFSPESPSIEAPSGKVSPAGKGRVIFQFKHRSAGFFTMDGGAKNINVATEREGSKKWDIQPGFYRWRYRNGVIPEPAPEEARENIEAVGYHRIILSAFHWADDKALKHLQEQCRGMSIHHEISARFVDVATVNKYLAALKKVYKFARVKTAGMNDEELAAFTSWHGTEAFAAARPDRKDSFLQSMFRAMKVREALGLDWLYVHGNDIDITVVRPDPQGQPPNKQYLEQLRNAMLLAKVVVFAALHVRAGIKEVEDRFELSCSPKGFLALNQFARAFAEQYGASDNEREKLQRGILLDGYFPGDDRIPSVVTVPVYWPDPHEDCSVTGAGDISSGVTAATAS